VTKMIRAASKNSGASLISKCDIIFIRFPFYAFSLYAATRRNATPVCNESHLYKNVEQFVSLICETATNLTRTAAAALDDDDPNVEFRHLYRLLWVEELWNLESVKGWACGSDGWRQWIGLYIQIWRGKYLESVHFEDGEEDGRKPLRLILGR
jgi:hypothetical protein